MYTIPGGPGTPCCPGRPWHPLTPRSPGGPHVPVKERVRQRGNGITPRSSLRALLLFVLWPKVLQVPQAGLAALITKELLRFTAISINQCVPRHSVQLEELSSSTAHHPSKTPYLGFLHLQFPL